MIETETGIGTGTGIEKGRLSFFGYFSNSYIFKRWVAHATTKMVVIRILKEKIKGLKNWVEALVRVKS